MSDAKTGFAAPAPARPGEFGATNVAILATRWNVEVVDALIAGAKRELGAWGLNDDQSAVVRAPGAFELPLAAQALLASSRFDAVIALGAVIRGDTPHFDYVCNECARGVLEVQLKYSKPVAFGVLTVNTPEQAYARCGDGPDNKGAEAAAAALDMLRLIQSHRAA